MSKALAISDAELGIMKVLWAQEEATSAQILAALPAGEEKNRSTFKTLLLRLVQKGAVTYEEINSRTYKYRAIVTQEQYVAASKQNFLTQVFDGSAQKMLLNFVQEQQITKADLQQLLDLIESED